MVRENKLYHEVYLASSDTFACRTRSGQRYGSKLIAYGHSDFQRCASMTLLQEGQVFLQSLLHWFELLAQSLIIIHDGSYMKEISPSISSAATMIYCTIAKAWCKCTWAKKLTSAGLYHSEILGGVMTQLILHAAASSYHDTIPPVVVDCDNNGVMIHRNNFLWPLSTNQSQADLLQVFKHLISSQPFRVQYKYVPSHADKKKKWWDCTLKECINIKVDRLAKKALKTGHCTGQFIKTSFLNEQIWFTLGGRKL